MMHMEHLGVLIQSLPTVTVASNTRVSVNVVGHGSVRQNARKTYASLIIHVPRAGLEMRSVSRTDRSSLLKTATGMTVSVLVMEDGTVPRRKP